MLTVSQNIENSLHVPIKLLLMLAKRPGVGAGCNMFSSLMLMFYWRNPRRAAVGAALAKSVLRPPPPILLNHALVIKLQSGTKMCS